MTQTILGAGGPIGTTLAKALAQYTENIKLVSRNPRKVNLNDTLFPADLTKKEDVFKAVDGSEIVYLTVGFPYRTKVWEKAWPELMRHIIDACLQYNARLVFYDNVYAIGGDNVNHITENSPISPTSRKGNIRAIVDRMILDAVEKRNLQAIIARSPDFFGAKGKANSLMMNLVYNNLIKNKKAQWFCNAKVIHSVAYVPDLGKGTAMLGNTMDAYNQIWNLPTDVQKITGKEWIHLFAAEMGTTDKYRILPNWLIRSMGLFVPLMSELHEMNYQYDRDYYFDSSKFNSRFKYTPTPNAIAVKQTVEELKN